MASNGAPDVNVTFARALAAEREVTDTFWAVYGFDQTRSAGLLDAEKLLKERMREWMESGEGGGRLFRISDEITPHLRIARKLLDDGEVAAVDGTSALEKLDFMMTTQYACAVGWITSRERGTPHITITETVSDYIDLDELRRATSREMLSDLYQRKDQARIQESWPTTFREYQERRVALAKCSGSIVIIDGPIFTQNLMTQPEGRSLYNKMLISKKDYIGVIKNLNGSWPECVWAAGAIERGEGYVICPVGEPAKRRATGTEWTSWIENSGVNDYVRVVFRPAEKAFSFECKASALGLSLAILIADASPTINHELPLLLETVDSQLRSGFNANAARDMVLARHMSMPGGYRTAIDATDERDYR